MYKNFICYRGGSSAGVYVADELYKKAKEAERVVGKTYFSLYKDEDEDNRNFLKDPDKYLVNVENFIILLTRHFFDDFIIDNKPNENSVTRIEIDIALKNKNIRFIPVTFNDFSWDGETKEVITTLWGNEAYLRLRGSIPSVKYSYQRRNNELDSVISILKNENESLEEKKFVLKSTYITPKSVFCGRDEILEEIKDKFNNGEHVIFLKGIGGIGKTEIAKQFAIRNREDFDTVIYATYNGSIVDLINSEISFKIEPAFTKLDQEDDVSFFRRKLKLLQDISDERTLVIIDNFDTKHDEHFEELVNANFKMIITTRFGYFAKDHTTIKVEPLNSMDQLISVFMQNYEGFAVEANDPKLVELIELVNRHTYTIELIAQHMENSGQSIEEMIDTLKKKGIVSLDEQITSSNNQSLAYETLLKMFDIFDLSEEEETILQFLSIMPLSGVKGSDFVKWMNLKSTKSIIDLNRKSWIDTSNNIISVHPIIRDVVKHKLPLKVENAKAFIDQFNETIKEEKSWHFSIIEKSYYADISLEILNNFNEINEYTEVLYKNVELLLSFSIKPAKAVELCEELFNYYKTKDGESCFGCAYTSFQAGWTYLFNMHSKSSLSEAKRWFDISLEIFKKIKLNTEDELAVYGHLLSHLSRYYLIQFESNKDEKMFNEAKDFAKGALDNALNHFDKGSIYYSRIAVGYMQLTDVYIANKNYEKALPLIDNAYQIVVSMFGENDPDSLNVSSRKSSILYYLGRYSEALEIGKKNIEAYTKFYGELNLLRFEQLLIVLKCHRKLNQVEEFNKLKEDAIRIAQELFEPNSTKIKEVEGL